MTVFDRIKELSKRQGKSVSKVALDLGFSENLFYRWKKSEPKAKDLEKVADYFHVSLDYLLGRSDDPYSGLSPEQRDLTVEEALKSVMSYDGEPLTDNDREILAGIIEAYLEKKKG